MPIFMANSLLTRFLLRNILIKLRLIPILLIRLNYGLLVYASYLIQVLLLGLGYQTTARAWLEQSARLAVKMLGINVQMINKPPQTPHPIIFLGNHDSPIDVLIVQGYLKERSISTVADYLKYIFPFFAKSLKNYGHVQLKHTCQLSRRSGYYQLSEMLRNKNNLFIFPSGSMVTKITQRVSPSSYYHALKNNAVIVPIFFNYEAGDEILALQQNIRNTKSGRFNNTLLLYRFISKKMLLTCSYGSIIYPSEFSDKHAFCEYIKTLYITFERSKNTATAIL